MVLKPEGMYPEKLFHLHKLLIIAPLIFFFFLIQSKGVWNLGLIELYCILKFQIGLITVLLRLTDTKQFHIIRQSSWYEAGGIISLICKSGRIEAEPWKSIPVGHKAQDVSRSCSQHPNQDRIRSEQLQFFAGLNPWYQWHSLVLCLFNSFPKSFYMRDTVSPDFLWFSFLFHLPPAQTQPVRNP